MNLVSILAMGTWTYVSNLCKLILNRIVVRWKKFLILDMNVIIEYVLHWYSIKKYKRIFLIKSFSTAFFAKNASSLLQDYGIVFISKNPSEFEYS